MTAHASRSAPQRGDALIAGALALAVLAEQVLAAGVDALTPVKLLGCAALAWRRTHPVVAAPAAVTLLGGGEFVQPGDTDTLTGFAVMLVALFSLAAHAPRRGVVPAAAAVTLLVCAISGQASLNDRPGQTEAGAALVGALFAVLILCLPAYAIGWAARRQGELRDRLEEQARLLERERDRHAAAAADEERARVAAELHEAVTSGVRAMLAELEDARRAVAAGAPDAGAAVLRVEERGRDALADMRRQLGVLRRGDEDLALAPHPSLARVEALARRAARDGLDVALRIEGTPRAVTPGLDAAAYRIVEDALVHAAGAARADVLVRWAGRDVELEVDVDGPQLGDPAPLAGLRDRADCFGGRVEATRRPHGHSAVRARMPIGGRA